jgi:GDPmannose 4,6-dehydratase
MKKVALIFGVTGQDGSYLAEFLLKKKYIVYGVIRRSSSPNTHRIDHIYQDRHDKKYNFRLCYGDLTDSLSISQIINNTKPDEIYNLAAQSHVAVSFEIPEYTANTDALGALRILEIIKTIKSKKIKYYQAGTSEMFGKTKSKFQNEKTNFLPASPYGVAKLYAHWITINYRQAYNIYACNGILFNHESPRRGINFVTKKIITGLCNIKKNKQKILYLGNLYAKRDWGYAPDYCEAMWKILQQKKPDDYVIATGKTYSVKEFINFTCKYLNINIRWKGFGTSECAINRFNNKIIIKIDKDYFRPVEVDYLLGDAKKARKVLKWKPKTSIQKLVQIMVDEELNLSK